MELIAAVIIGAGIATMIIRYYYYRSYCKMQQLRSSTILQLNRRDTKL
jgi:hypothetical protein